MPKFAANLTMLFNEMPFVHRFAAAKAAGFGGVESDGGAGALDDFALGFEFFLGEEIVESGAKGFGADAAPEAGAEVFTRNAGEQRIFFMEFFDAGGDFLTHIVEELSGDEKEGITRDDSDTV